jgi:hypothetical protein
LAALWLLLPGDALHEYLTSKFDAAWYIGIAAHGYQDYQPSVMTNMSFFPLLPMLMRGLATVTGLTVGDAGVVISLFAGVAAAWAMGLIARQTLSEGRAGVFLAVVWAWLPHSTVLSMTYTEALFTALAAWALWAILDRHWILGGVLSCAAGLTRSAGAAIIAVTCIACLAAIVTSVRSRGSWRSWLSPLIGMLLAPSGLVGFLAYVGQRVGAWDGYLRVQAPWGNGLDGGWHVIRGAGSALLGRSGFNGYVVLLMLLGYGVLLLLTLRAGRSARQPWQLLLYSVLITVMALIFSTSFHCRARLMLPAFTLLFPIASGLQRLWQQGRKGMVVACLILAAFAVATVGFGYYLIMIWEWSP